MTFFIYNSNMIILLSIKLRRVAMQPLQKPSFSIMEKLNVQLGKINVFDFTVSCQKND